MAVRLTAVFRASSLLLTIAALVVRAADPVSFSKQIEPIFENTCWKCHGAALQLSHLDLRTREGALKGGEHGPAIVPGNADQSRMFRLVSGQEKPSMPMDGTHLTPEQIRAIKDWIDAGATWEGAAPAAQSAALPANVQDPPLTEAARKYWAFQKPEKRPLPETGRRFQNPIDAFLDRALKDHGLEAAPQADARTLVRRAYLDLTGLLPTPAEVTAYLGDRSPDRWERLVDRLLASLHYGERWGRHWLDVARYADSNGFEHDFDRPNAWRYRDYVIRAFNEDKPYDEFLKEQIAGDELEHVTKESLIATGFLRCYAKVGFREKDNPQFRYDYLDDMIATIGRGILGLTVQCARCHNHKFDPISQKDYYRLEASLFGYVEVDQPLTSPEEAAAYETKLADIEAHLRPLREEIRRIEQPYRDSLLPEKYKEFPENVQIAIRTPEAQRTPGQALLAAQIIRTTNVSSKEVERVMRAGDLQRKRDLAEAIHRIEKERPAPIPVAMGITDGDYRFTPDGPGDEPEPGKGVKQEVTEGSFLFKGTGRYRPPPSYFLYHGDYQSRGPVMEPGFIRVITYGSPAVELPPSNGRTSGRRLALAEWLTSRDNPLTARVIVNRVWHHHFGRGIVATLDNFGKMGEKPTHPELLDWLACDLMDHGWSLKYLHRLIMNSRAYQRASEYENPADQAKDPDDTYLWRFRLQRLDAESVRDVILAASGALNTQMNGPPVFPKLPPEVLHSMNKGIWEQEEDGPNVWRRSVYVYRKRGLPFPMFEVFDLPDQNITCSRRNVSTVPTQALTLLNDDFVLRQAQLFADRVKESAPGDPAAQVRAAYEIALGRPPTGEESRLALDFLKKQKLAGFTHVLLNLNEFMYMR
ncbi:MAG TPA: PSD1 and planctomycete cytochrome C domain-containing protein [Bryobacteraceae bacterium]|nr:PSD1 and planctomycete cytochrome C domain-containing protein [Bryobacteraceae bacterium]